MAWKGLFAWASLRIYQVQGWHRRFLWKLGRTNRRLRHPRYSSKVPAIKHKPKFNAIYPSKLRNSKTRKSFQTHWIVRSTRKAKKRGQNNRRISRKLRLSWVSLAQSYSSFNRGQIAHANLTWWKSQQCNQGHSRIVWLYALI